MNLGKLKLDFYEGVIIHEHETLIGDKRQLDEYSTSLRSQT